MPEIAAFGFMGSQASQGLFGANVLATRSSLEQGGDYDRLIEELGVGSFRYPGGSLTERYFDITDRLRAEEALKEADQTSLEISEDEVPVIKLLKRMAVGDDVSNEEAHEVCESMDLDSLTVLLNLLISIQQENKKIEIKKR